MRPNLPAHVKPDWFTDVTATKQPPQRLGRPPGGEHLEIDPVNSKEEARAARTSLL